MPSKNINSIVYTESFISKWKSVLQKLFNYDKYMDFMIVPSITQRKHLSYLPLLNYTDMLSADVNELLELGKDNNYQIRYLDFDYIDFKNGDSTTMRLDICSKSSKDIWEKDIKSRCRNKIRNSIKKNNFTIKYGNDDKIIIDFYFIFLRTMHRLGTPAFSIKLLYLLREYFNNDILFFVVYKDDKPIASMCTIFDMDIVWYPWGGTDPSYSKDLVGYFIYWKAIEHITDNYNKKIFDFSRSKYNGNTYSFKSQFGALPVKINIIRNNTEDEDIHAKYSLVSSVWKKLPNRIADYIGPKIYKYILDA